MSQLTLSSCYAFLKNLFSLSLPKTMLTEHQRVSNIGFFVTLNVNIRLEGLITKSPTPINADDTDTWFDICFWLIILTPTACFFFYLFSTYQMPVFVLKIVIYNANSWHRYHYLSFGSQQIDTEMSEPTSDT